MIEILEGTHETINYGNSMGVRMFHNVDYEDYPEHWHTAIEIIMPVHEGYNVIAGEKKYCLKEGDILILNSGTLHALEAPPKRRTYYSAIQRLSAVFTQRNGNTSEFAAACHVFFGRRRFPTSVQFYKKTDGCYCCGV